MSDRDTDSLDASDFQAPDRQTQPPAAAELHICAACGSNLVYPLEWGPTADKRWSVVLCCPDCEAIARGVYAQADVDRLDEELDRGAEQILDDLTSLSRANMEDQVERFVAALHAGHIVADDF